MSDLISRSCAIENIWDVFNSYANDSQRFDEYETEAINNAFTVLQKTIENQPTAYDPDKVVAELEERRSEYEIHSENAPDVASAVYRKGVMRGYEYSQDIVRKGGVHETD